MKNSTLILALGLLALAGCGDGGGKSSSSAPPPLALVSISVSPTTATLDTGQSVKLVCTGRFEDGSEGPVSADWTGPETVKVITPFSSSDTFVKWKLPGPPAVVTAKARGCSADVTITLLNTDPIPDDPGPVYGADANGPSCTGLYRYPALGGGAPLRLRDTTDVCGITMNAAVTEVYYVDCPDAWPEPKQVRKFVIDTGKDTLLALLPNDICERPIGMDLDNLGRPVTVDFSTGNIIRVDPVTGEIEIADTTMPTAFIDIAASPDGHFFTSPLWEFPWLWKSNPAGGFWGLAMNDGNDGFHSTSGAVVSRDGDVYITSSSASNKLYRYRESDAPGNFAPYETFCEELFPPEEACFIWGVAAAGGGTILVNVVPLWGEALPHSGIWWLADRNGDGDADDPGEKVLYNARWVSNGETGHSLVAPRRW